MSIFFFFIAYTRWDAGGREDATISSVGLFAGLLGLRFIVKVNPVFDIKVNYPKTLVSSDGFVIAIIKRLI